MKHRTKKIYAIQHNKTKRIYIGSSIRPEERYMSHIYNLRAGKHPVEDMQSDFNEHGENFSFYILDEWENFADRTKEYDWMHKYNSTQRGIGYNYKDHEKAHSTARIDVVDGLPLPYFEDEELLKIKNSLLDEINTLATKCSDVSLLDLIARLLKKGCNYEY